MGSQETSCQASQTPITQARVLFVVGDLLEIQPQLVQRFGSVILDAQVEQGVAHGAPHQELQG